MTTFWATKYALTSGIEKVEAEDPATTDHPSMLVIRPEGVMGCGQYYHGEGNDWHRSEKAAKERAEFIREKKIAALKKQIAKLDKMKFT
jgi:hypothetical protein